MTSEIAIMNKEAIALATDSAVTVTRTAGHKIYPSANKLFCFSKYEPVGIMIYGSASFMSIPWETIIKTYRKNLGKRKFATLKQYGRHFIAFLRKPHTMFPASEQELYFLGLAGGFFISELREEIEKNVKSEIETKGPISEEKVPSIISSTIRETIKSLRKVRSLFPKAEELVHALTKKYGGKIDQIVRETLEELPLTKWNFTQLRRIAGYVFVKICFLN